MTEAPGGVRRTRRWVRRLVGLLGIGLVAAIGSVLFYQEVLVPELDAELAGLESWRPPTTVHVLDEKERIVDRFFLVRRVWVPIEELPDILVEAVVTAEDRRFFEHPGVDVLGIIRALVANARAGRVLEGGSTITQQVVKNVVVGKERSLVRKVREALLALRLEQRMDKLSILELYLNLIYLGAGNYGVEAAARDYFNISARELDLASASLIAGIVPAPSRFSPRSDPKLALERRHLVLAAMLEEGRITEAEANAAGLIPAVPPPRGGSGRGGGEGYLTEVRREVRRLLGQKRPFEAGLRVHTAMSIHLQRASEEAIREAAAAIEARQGMRLQVRETSAEERETFLTASGSLTSTAPGSCFPVLALGGEQVAAGGRRFRVEPKTWSARVWNSDPEGWPSTFALSVSPGDVFDACLTEDGQIRPSTLPYVEGAAVVLEHRTGRVVALVGGRDMPIEGFHRATQARRQAGSAFKPFVYGTALDLGRTQLDVVLDAPLALDAGGNRLWEPQNASRGFWGPVALRWAFAFSLNTVAVRLVMDHGTAAVIERARAAGVRSPLRRDLTMALGTSEVHPIELAVGIAGIVRGGVAIEPTIIERLVDVRGREVGRAGEAIQLPGVDARLPGGEGPRFLKAATAWEVLEMMRAVVTRGTGRAAFAANQDRGGKTGTSSDYDDAWFVGFTPEHVIVVWIGQDDGGTLGRGETGDRAALPAWRAIADTLPPGEPLKPPPEVIPLPFGGEWIHVAPENVPTSRLPWRVPPRPEPLAKAPLAPICE